VTCGRRCVHSSLCTQTMHPISSLRSIAALACLGIAACTSADARETPAPRVAFRAVQPGAVRYIVAASGNTARYRVREQLMGKDFPNDAVGETAQVTGAITLDNAGRIVADQSKFVVNVGVLKSDSDRRDGFIKNRVMEVEKFPTVTLVPTALRGLPANLASAGVSAPVTFELVGDLTVKGVTHPTTWRVTARRNGDQVIGSVSTRFTFADFSLTQPKVPILLSVADTIGLEYDFTIAREVSSNH
jgi:polyisoprenoid-binding protein YceI